MSVEATHSKTATRIEKATPANRTEAEVQLIGESLPIQSLRRIIDRIARTDAPVLVTGETGTGKELVARLIHARSRRSSKPMITVNCPALPADLFHAEVFGSEKGAYTGAWRRNTGRVEAAEGGTLFLDEIGDLAPETQVILLRFLQEGTFERLGSTRSIQSDTRIIAATHVNLEAAREKKRFRDDLYYRLKALHLHVPPLRDRGSDIQLLAQHFVDEYCTRLGLRRHRLSADVIEALCRHSWPGNVRELRHNVLQTLVMCDSTEISACDLRLVAENNEGTDEDKAGPIPCLRKIRDQAERRAIRQTLSACDGDVSAAARRLEISRAQLYRLIKRHSLETGPQ